jgi:predicted CXXCH cytochrome family protein
VPSTCTVSWVPQASPVRDDHSCGPRRRGVWGLPRGLFWLGAVAVSLVAVPGWVGVLSGQAETRGHGASRSPELAVQRCGVCHAPHAAGSDSEGCRIPTDFLLRQPTSRPGSASLSCAVLVGAGAPGAEVSAVSRSCLRCHSSRDGRINDGGFRGGSVETAPSGSFLGDLGNDHPLALASEDAPSDRRVAVATRNILAVRRRAVPEAPGSSEGGPRPECTTCHGVHADGDPAFSEEAKRDICLDCHEAAAYMTSHPSVVCSDCHSVHGGHEPGLLAEASLDLLCQSCHQAGAAGQRAGVVAPPQLQRPEHLKSRANAARLVDRLRGVSEGKVPAEDCLACHAAHR